MAEHGRPGCVASGRLACCFRAADPAGETPAGRTAETAVLLLRHRSVVVNNAPAFRQFAKEERKAPLRPVVFPL